MYGAILGDIIGSRFEFSKPSGFKYNKVELFSDDCFYTDDTVMSVATKYAIMNNISYAKAYKTFGKRYPNCGYGSMFKQWITSSSYLPYGSYGNGSAMRIGFIGEYFSSLDEVRKQSTQSAICTHNHESAIRGANAIACSVFLARRGVSKQKIKEYIEREFSYKLNRSLRSIRQFSKFDVTCEASVPLAIRCFLESDNFESCMRNVLSITCDTDTIAAISGSIAQAYYKDTGFDDLALLDRYLINRNNNDTFLYNWATKPYERKKYDS